MNRIEELRRKIGISRPELASRVGVDRTMLWRYEKDMNIPSDKIKIRIAKELGESIENIFFNNVVVCNATSSVLHRLTSEDSTLNPTGTD